MNRILCGVFALGLVFAVAQGLQCYNCAIGFWNLCLTTKVTCQSNELCYSGNGSTAFMKLKMKGCLAVSDCNLTHDVPFGLNSSLYKMTKTCCSTDLCNLAPQGAYGSFLSIALVTLTGAVITRALV